MTEQPAPSTLIGMKFGKLTVLEEGPQKGRRRTYLCLCECGNYTRPILGQSLKSGATKGCGCLMGYNRTTHGLCHTRIYSIWRGMKSRCYTKTNKSYHLYGGRGITVCAEWRGNAKAFYDWAMANGYTDELTIDRINPDGNYEPANCRWATWEEQNDSTRKKKRKGEKTE